VAGSPAPPKNFDNQPTVCFWNGTKHTVTLEVTTEEWLRQNLERFSEPLSYQSPCPNATDTIYGHDRAEGAIWCQVNGVNFQVGVREHLDGPPNTDAEYQAIGHFMATVLEHFS
jgi:hypothetical protein